METVELANAFGDELPPGTKLCRGQYTIERYLNSGGFGITYLARDSLGRKVVIKECFPGAMCCRTDETVRLRSRGSEPEFGKILELFEKEARALSELSHPYIVGVHQIFHDNGTAYMAIDFVPGRDLLQVIEEEPDRLGPEQIRQVLIKVLDAVSYMHDHDILHRDISPDNILLEADNTPVLIDFGAARESATRVSRVLSKILTVKDGYSPQEFYLAGSDQQCSSDLYALAATFYHLVSGSPPPSSNLRMSAAAKNSKDPLEPLALDTPGYDRYFIDAINKCLSIFPGERLQSAREWRDLIDVERRRRMLMEKAKTDKAMEQRVARLVREVQQELSAGTAAVPERRQRRAMPALPSGRRARPRLSAAEDSTWDILREPVPEPQHRTDTAADAEARAEADMVDAGGRRVAGPLKRLLGGTLQIFQVRPGRAAALPNEERP